MVFIEYAKKIYVSDTTQILDFGLSNVAWLQ